MSGVWVRKIFAIAVPRYSGPRGSSEACHEPQTVLKPRTKVKPKTQRPKLWKVILLNDDYTPREFVVQVLKAVFRMNADQCLPRDDDRAPAWRLRDRGLSPRTSPTPRRRKPPSSASRTAIRSTSPPSRRNDRGMQRVLITAGASGIGREIARAFAAKGGKVFVCDIDADALASFARNCPASPPRCDVASRRDSRTWSRRRCRARRARRAGQQCRHCGADRPVETMPPDEWEKVVAVNLNGTFNVTRSRSRI